jgi:hypothetical protein
VRFQNVAVSELWSFRLYVERIAQVQAAARQYMGGHWLIDADGMERSDVGTLLAASAHAQKKPSYERRKPLQFTPEEAHIICGHADRQTSRIRCPIAMSSASRESIGRAFEVCRSLDDAR